MPKRRSAKQIAAQKKAVEALKNKREAKKYEDERARLLLEETKEKLAEKAERRREKAERREEKKVERDKIAKENAEKKAKKEAEKKAQKRWDTVKNVTNFLWETGKTGMGMVRNINQIRNTYRDQLKNQMDSQPYMPFGYRNLNKYNEMLNTHRAYELKRMQIEMFDMPTKWKEASQEMAKAVESSRKYNEQLISHKANISTPETPPVRNEYGEVVEPPPGLDSYIYRSALRLDYNNPRNELSQKDKSKI